MNNPPLDLSIRLRAMWCHLSGIVGILLQVLSFSSSYFSANSSGSSSDIPNNITDALSAVLLIASSLSSLPFILPLIFWLFNRRMHPFVDRAGKDSINYTVGVFFQFVIFLILMIFISLVVCGVSNNESTLLGTLFVLSAIGIAAIVLTQIAMSIYAAIRASKGEVYNYPFVIRIFR